MSALPKQDLSSRFKSFKEAYSQEDKAYEVTIENDHGTVDVDYVILTLGDRDHERVKWVNNAQHQVSIVFYSSDGSPFDSPIFQVGPGGSETSGPISQRALDYKGYRYAVVGSKGSTDPTVIIDR
jgi:hypothetical protein